MNDRNNKGKTVVRHTTKDDAERVFELIAALAAHHGQTEFVLTDSAEIRRSISALAQRTTKNTPLVREWALP